MKLLLNLICFFLCLAITAQTTSIPDTNFEQHLINEGIDSDGVINGQVLTNDIATVNLLDLKGVSNLTGLEAFTDLEYLILQEGGVAVFPLNLVIDLTANSNLIDVEIRSFEGLKTIDLTGLINLENLTVVELQDDVITMGVEVLDLSTNPNIKFVQTGFLDTLREINLQNANNVNTTDMIINVIHYSNSSLCMKVDYATAATNNTAPYDSWTLYGVNPSFYDQGVCTLAADIANKIEVDLYPNPVQNSFQIETSEELKNVSVVSIAGEEVANFESQQNYNIAGLAAGVYFVKIQTAKAKRVQRIVKR
ncbi:T9SS type A sorting domain-containing protein [Mesonia ostreae]|uniref:T9SS type A sorting domain-containing protein n=1 Tax=Mesonia ostreae TaxID=861110 RepID=A0ABU2KF36_9FLAO|nr:T9SS type A sorting domain-containing protein [Mesonia ostreae]MDT0293310.1 T9SS type A sorting domain-containing protein [Mesonia ostreae]